MAWEQLSINKPHLAYIILGGFTSIFMLCSLVIKEKLYIGEASVATIVGVIFGRHAANLFDPMSWGNTDQITLECSRIVLVVQCFAVGVELPKSYMEKHWRSVILLLVPVMTWGWLVTSLVIWWMVEPLTWLESLACAACVTATDPVLASSVVGKGKFAKRVPRHLRDLLSAESGCNDGMAFPFIYLSLYLIKYRHHPPEVAYHWICFTILYECIFGAIYGFLVGYLARHAIKWAERRGIIDRESFLVFYFVLALFCAGSGSMLGMDDLLIGFSAGVGFSNDGWFTEKTEESHVSNVIDLLLNLAYFVYLGSIIPWEQYNAPSHGLVPWRLVVISIFVIFFRRIPIMLLLKPIIPDVKTWREALFAGHFGPIGVGAIFVAILARAELETDGGTTPLDLLPTPGTENYVLIYLIWPITTFLVVTSILVHGSSIAVFTLGKHINTLTITMSYTQDTEAGPSWMNRLPRISSQSKSMSRAESMDSLDKPDFPPGTLPPIGVPGQLLRRQKDDDTPRGGSRSSSLKPTKRRKWDSGLGPGGPVSQSAIHPQRRSDPSALSQQESGSDTLNEKNEDTGPESRLASSSRHSSADTSRVRHPSEAEAGDEGEMEDFQQESEKEPAEVEAYQEGHELIVEDEEGNVLATQDTRGQTDEEKTAKIEEVRKQLGAEKSGEHAKHKHESHAKNEGEEVEHALDQAIGHPGQNIRKHLASWKFGKKKTKGDEVDGSSTAAAEAKAVEKRKRGAANAYQFGNTIIVEDEDGEVIKKYTIPAGERPHEHGEGWRKMSSAVGTAEMRRGLHRMATWSGKKGGQSGQPSQPTDTDTHHVTPDPLTSAAVLAEGGGGDPSGGGGANKKGAARTDQKARGENIEDDAGLRYTISRTERYGLGGRIKDPVDINYGSGRRASAADFIRQIQQLDPRARVEAVNDSDAPDALKRQVKQDAHQERQEQSRTGRARAGTMPSTEGGSRSEFPFPSTDTRPNIRRGKTDTSTTTRHRSPPPPRSQSPESLTTESEDDTASIPQADISASIARYAQPGSAVAARRQRMSTIRSEDSRQGDQIVEEGEEGETAAEKRRRLAALGTSKDQETSSDEDEEAPRRPRERDRGAVQFASDAKGPETSSSAADAGRRGAQSGHKPRVSWGGETGRAVQQAPGEEGEGKEQGGEKKGRRLRWR